MGNSSVFGMPKNSSDLTIQGGAIANIKHCVIPMNTNIHLTMREAKSMAMLVAVNRNIDSWLISDQITVDT